MSNEKPRQNDIENSQEKGPRTDKQLEQPKPSDNDARNRAREAAKDAYKKK